jgi:hypothetical protein
MAPQMLNLRRHRGRGTICLIVWMLLLQQVADRVCGDLDARIHDPRGQLKI